MNSFQFYCIFIAFLVICNSGIKGLGHTRCKTSEDCEKPEYSEFCDQNFGACWSCDDYCSGDQETSTHCGDHCPRRYAEVYHGKDKTPDVPILPHGQTNGRKDDISTPSKTWQESKGGGSRRLPAVTIFIILGGLLFVVLLVIVVVGVRFLWNKRKSSRDPDLETAEMQTLDDTTDKSTEEENTGVNEEIQEETYEDYVGETQTELDETICHPAEANYCSHHKFALPKDQSNSDRSKPSSFLDSSYAG